MCVYVTLSGVTHCAVTLFRKEIVFDLLNHAEKGCYHNGKELMKEKRFVRIINDMNIMQAKIKLDSQCQTNVNFRDFVGIKEKTNIFGWCNSRINYLSVYVCVRSARLFKTELTKRITTHSFSSKDRTCHFKWNCFG